MKKIVASLAIIGMFSLGAIAQPQPGNNGDTGAVGGDPIGGGAPVGSGIAVLLAAGAAYGSKKVFDARKRLND